MIVSAVLAACSGDAGRELTRYYDPEGYFSMSLPAENTITVASPRSGGDGPGLLAGVVAQPPAPSPATEAGGALDVTQTEEQDRTTYQALAVTTGGFDDLTDMGLFFLTADTGIDVQIDEAVTIDGHEGRLVVADVEDGGQPTAGVAVAMTLGTAGTGYVLAAVFSPGDWERERPDFLRVLRSFRADVPPGLGTFPVTG